MIFHDFVDIRSLTLLLAIQLDKLVYEYPLNIRKIILNNIEWENDNKN